MDKFLFTLFAHSLFFYGLYAQKNSTIEQKEQEYLNIIEQNSHLKADTVEISTALSKLRAENHNLIQQRKRDSISVQSFKEEQVRLSLKEKEMRDSLTQLLRQETSLRELIKTDCILFDKMTHLKANREALNNKNEKLIQEHHTKDIELKDKEHELGRLKKYSEDVESSKREKKIQEGKKKEQDEGIKKTGEELFGIIKKVDTMKEDRNIFSFFNKQEIESIKSRKNLMLSQLTCTSQRNTQVDSYLNEMNQLLSSGLLDSDISEIQQSIINYETSCQWIKEVQNALNQKYDHNSVQNLLNQLRPKENFYPQLQKNKNLLDDYCKKSRSAFMYINEASQYQKKLLQEYIDVVLNEFNDYPFLKSELVRFKNTKTHSLEPVICQ